MAPRRAPSKARRRKPARDEKKSKAGLWAGVALLLLLAAYVGVLNMSRPQVGGDRLRFDVFVNFVEQRKIKSAHILDEDSFVTGTYVRQEGGPIRPYNSPLVRSYQGRLVDSLVANAVPTTVDQQTKKRVAGLAVVLLPGLAIVVLFTYLILSSRRGTGLFKVRSGAKKITAEEGGVTFADVAGQDAAVAELREIRDFLADPKRYADLGAQIPKGVLLFGPPGCGKTMLAKAVAGEAGASFYSISGSDFVEMFVGVGAARVRDLFKVARENSPAVIFIDEIDSIGRSRSSGVATGGSSGEQEQSLNQVLAEMDGFSTQDGIIVLAATNRPDILDPALLRPGRFDRSVGLERPDESSRLAILEVHRKEKRLGPDVDLAAIARTAVGFTGADLASVMNESALLAARAGKDAISQAELDQALKRILEAPERQRRLSMRDRTIGRRFSEEEKISFDDVAGQEAAVAELREIKEYLSEPERYAAVGAKVPRGVLLFGPPGCGKTLMARALASEANAAFFSVSATEFVEVLVGQGASRVRDLFAQARQMAPAILFIDELDSLGRSRGGVAGARQGAQGEQEQALNQILTEMDGFSSTNGVIVLGATNRPDVLDPALLRPGRFDRTIGLELPNEEGRLAILELHSSDKVLEEGVDLAAVAGRAHGLTGADLANVMNEAALLAARAGRTSVSQADLDESLQRTIQAPERQRRLSMRSKSIGKRFASDERVTFADLAGVDDAVEELRDVKDYLANPERFADMGASPPKGVLLSGPPGCGKTLLARAVAGEANAAFISVAASEFVEVFVGEGAARVRDLFAEARSMAPAIVFIDEIDAVGGRRSANSSDGGREVENTLNQILTELDGFEARATVIVMAATNRPDMLDSALVRPGRFDRKVEISMPDRAGRRAILDVHVKGKRLRPDIDLDALAGQTRGFSGADLANVVNEAALLATRRGEDVITPDIIDEAIDRAVLGITSRRHVMSDDERRVVAYHEAGHAIVARSVEGAVPPYKLTIVPRGGTLGHCSLSETHDRLVHSRSMLIGRMAVFFGGFVAERMVFGESGSGTQSDLAQVNDIARRMVCDLGMSEELGALGSLDSSRGAALSPEVASAIRRLADEAQAMAQSILERDRAALERVAEALLDQETIKADELEALASAAPPAPPAATARRRNGGSPTTARAAATRNGAAASKARPKGAGANGTAPVRTTRTRKRPPPPAPDLLQPASPSGIGEDFPLYSRPS